VRRRSLLCAPAASLQLADEVSIGRFPLLARVIGVVVIAGLGQFLARIRTGGALRATSDDQEAARLIGVDDRRLYAAATAITLSTFAMDGVSPARAPPSTRAPGTTLIFAFERSSFLEALVYYLPQDGLTSPGQLVPRNRRCRRDRDHSPGTQGPARVELPPIGRRVATDT
jgi:hypothetical protein